MSDPRLTQHPLGFLQLADMPTPEELSAYYRDLYYQTERSSSYATQYPPEEIDYRNLKLEQQAKLIGEIRETGAPGSLLDVGCGEGFALAWYKRNGWSVSGLDFSSAGVVSMNPEVESDLETGDVFAKVQERIEGGASYDVVYLNNVLEHVLDPVRLLTDLRSLVSPSGVLVVTVPNDDTRYHHSLLEDGTIPRPFWIVAPDHISYFNQDTLRRTAEATGWSMRRAVADFPIDLFLMHEGSNYVRDPSKGRQAHQARLRMEQLVAEAGPESVNRFYEALAGVGLGRNLTAFMVAA